jgi:hypothetical protein
MRNAPWYLITVLMVGFGFHAETQETQNLCELGSCYVLSHEATALLV